MSTLTLAPRTTTPRLAQLRSELDIAQAARRQARATLRGRGGTRHPITTHAQAGAAARALRNVACADARVLQIESRIEAAGGRIIRRNGTVQVLDRYGRTV